MAIYHTYGQITQFLESNQYNIIRDQIGQLAEDADIDHKVYENLT